ncbi:MAG: polyamine ABC transporter substrate-binding protein [Microbacterium sp. 67-17]|jgi:spermidine/putrescine transport system substrate-binding protein|uniref:ABC transporter substrate-binding protein n=1 Tax=Microbacterium sp. 67-17 TaxID=1895782 RepID=UPI0009638892|nr:spermidine/putrescine ABC transporter substrate-binding protein [Microbacterium sp. 67-17]OJW01351.1 MAG: polyamine ABC transporter substrate-binding protein [Microbacterium sp. 67-17]
MPDRPLPSDPMIRALISQARAAQISRRGVLAGAGALSLMGFLAACTGRVGGSDSTGGSALTAPEDLSSSVKTLTWANWSFYLDEDDEGNHPTLQAFEDQTGITVNYDVAIDDNNTYFAKVRDQLALGQGIGADTVCLTDWMANIWIASGYTQAFDKANMGNVYANLNPSLMNPSFDPGRANSVPWQSGFAGLAWNTEKLPNGLASIDDLWNPDLKGRVGVLSEMRDTIGLIMLSQGVDITSDSWGDTEFQNAIDVFAKQVSDGQIRNIKGNSYADDLINEDTLAAIVWSGDITAINAEVGYDKFGFALPDSGGTLWSDNFMIPIGSQQKTNVETLIDYYYQPEVAAEVAAWVNYITPVVGAQEAMADIDPEMVDNQLIFPDEATLANAYIFRALSNQEQEKYNAEFEAVGLGA